MNYLYKFYCCRVRNVILRRFVSLEYLEMQSCFEAYKKEIKSLEVNKVISSDDIFCNNEVDLSNINCYGFDYDYTLAQYTKQLEKYIYDEARKLLVATQKYPEQILSLEMNPNFAIRGLHYDVRNGLFMKVDAYNNIQLDSVYRGQTAVPESEILELYNGTYIPKQMLTKQTSDADKLSQLLDLFVVPEMNLLGNIIQMFVDNGIEFDPAYLYQDVSRAVRSIHKSGRMHFEVSNNLEQYIQFNPQLNLLLTLLKDNNKKLFLITNSDFHFVNLGMIHLTQTSRWTDFFDVVITSAKKPDFFLSTKKPFRCIINGQSTWSSVRNFSVSQTYKEGNLSDFMKYTGWNAKEIFYFGDHIYADLADVATTQGWTTGAIIREISEEIAVLNTVGYQQSLKALLLVEKLIYQFQHVKASDARARYEYWSELRCRLRQRTKKQFNPYFGSLFRTYHNPSYFCQRISVYADVYTSSVNNLMKYPLNHHFYPKRQILPHEPLIA